MKNTKADRPECINVGWVTIYASLEQPACHDINLKLIFFASRKEAETEVLSTIEEHIQQYKDGDRAFDEIDFNIDEEVRFASYWSNGVTVIHATDQTDSEEEFFHFTGCEDLVTAHQMLEV